jgi:glycerophosphoryl diester phosphodiesterase
VDFWTVNEPGLAERLVALGADGIMTDDPARIVPVVRRASGPPDHPRVVTSSTPSA